MTVYASLTVNTWLIKCSYVLKADDDGDEKYDFLRDVLHTEEGLWPRNR